MKRVIAIANQKGGVGKTTTSINLAACLAKQGKKVLIIDSDPQGNTTSGLGVAKDRLPKTFYNLLLGGCYIEEILIKTKIENLTLVPSNVNLAGAEIELVDYEKREYLLKKIVKNLKYLYDFVIIDCPPSLSMLTLNALTAADSIIVPIQCEYFALEGLSQLLHTINLVKKKLNKNLEIEGVVFTMYDSRTNLSSQVVEEVKKHLDKNVYRSIIPRNIRLSEAPSHGLPIIEYDPKSKGATSYMDLAKQVIKKRKSLKKIDIEDKE
ncbi:MAG: AAA family ATPase [Defluviitaleaceae bacterium]|nr:AAA family ATPase [Defluviitaleaceae bacterium]